jgi:hypothetical protein
VTRYAEKTEVPADRSRNEIERTLTRYGAQEFHYGWRDGGKLATIGFRANGKLIRFELPLPDPNDPEFVTTSQGRPRSTTAARAAWEQASRQRWRALALAVKAKLEAVAAGIATFEEEFLAYILMPDGQSVGDHAIPALLAAYETGKMQRLLPAAGSPS